MKKLHYLNYYGFFAKHVVGLELVTEKLSGQGRDSSRLAAEVAVKSFLNSQQLISTLKLLELSVCNHVLGSGLTLNALILMPSQNISSSLYIPSCGESFTAILNVFHTFLTSTVTSLGSVNTSVSLTLALPVLDLTSDSFVDSGLGLMTIMKI